MKRFALALLATVAATASQAAPETYTLDPTHTLPGFSVRHFGMSTVQGLFEGATGKVVIDRAAKTGSVEIKIATAGIYTGYNKPTGAGRTRDEHLRSADFFNVAEFPEMTFKSTKVVFAGETPSSIEGTLTLLGVTRPLTLKVDSFNCGANPMSKKEMCGADVSGSIKRSDFGMKYAVPAIADEVKLVIAVEGYKQ
ncbi:MAG: YceI family protein [Rubrivivax sp.]